MSKWNNKETEALAKAVLALKTVDEARKFLRDLLTESELIEFGKRWQVAKMLENKISYSKIEKITGLSSTTIARISQWLNSGMGGYKLLISRLHHTNPSGK